ncbi:hypothetical protein P152DRAFT_451544 [Eremomyces bilateralis CBS 781.70]|uniref:Uncharacterized protein n=1 Tax=Eremomyces bilateralis CBS 781.70 TaxID=1392243 RepID=A0A6G1FW13_9PEZI|nr:uncharacterized protein P152DRAFT_451544 [Eremomyces bilateralis CBS 781.70]KAF1809882.1 hypothetical protein P152DRAFT_451544 [Eremomyces bilateralis CBS 781.70]
MSTFPLRARACFCASSGGIGFADVDCIALANNPSSHPSSGMVHESSTCSIVNAFSKHDHLATPSTSPVSSSTAWKYRTAVLFNAWFLCRSTVKARFRGFGGPIHRRPMPWVKAVQAMKANLSNDSIGRGRTFTVMMETGAWFQ